MGVSDEDVIKTLGVVRDYLVIALQASSDQQKAKLIRLGDPTPHYYIEGSLEKISALLDRLSDPKEENECSPQKF